MLAPGRTTYAGPTIAVRDAINVPRGLQEPRVPILVGGNGPNRTWRLAARFADELNLDWFTPEEVTSARPVIASRCEEIGRDPRTLRLSVNIGRADAAGGGSAARGHAAPVRRCRGRPRHDAARRIGSRRGGLGSFRAGLPGRRLRARGRRGAWRGLRAHVPIRAVTPDGSAVPVPADHAAVGGIDTGREEGRQAMGIPLHVLAVRLAQRHQRAHDDGGILPLSLEPPDPGDEPVDEERGAVTLSPSSGHSSGGRMRDRSRCERRALS